MAEFVSDSTKSTADAPTLSRQLAYAFCGKLRQSQKADVSERLGIKLDYSLPALERDKRFLRAVADAEAVGILEAAVSSFLPDKFAAPPAMDREAVETLVQPWADYHGDLPDYDHPLRPVYESGIQYAVMPSNCWQRSLASPTGRRVTAPKNSTATWVAR